MKIISLACLLLVVSALVSCHSHALKSLAKGQKNHRGWGKISAGLKVLKALGGSSSTTTPAPKPPAEAPKVSTEIAKALLSLVSGQKPDPEQKAEAPKISPEIAEAFLSILKKSSGADPAHDGSSMKRNHRGWGKISAGLKVLKALGGSSSTTTPASKPPAEAPKISPEIAKALLSLVSGQKPDPEQKAGTTDKVSSSVASALLSLLSKSSGTDPAHVKTSMKRNHKL